MDNTVTVNDFNAKFSRLSEQNQNYIIAIQQALLYAQDSESAEKADNDKKCTEK